MAVLLPGLALVRDTTGHDWYAAGKLVLTEAMLAIGFDASAPTEYRAADGSVRRLTRLRFTYTVEAWQARRHILSTISENALLGAGAGFAGAFLLAILSKVSSVARRERVPVAKSIRPDIRLGTKTGPGIAGVLSRYTNMGERTAGLATPEEMERLTGTFEQAEPAAQLPTTGLPRNAAKEPYTLAPPEAAAADTVNADESENTASGRTDTPNSSADGPSPKKVSGRNSGTIANGQPNRPEPDDEVGWF